MGMHGHHSSAVGYLLFIRTPCGPTMWKCWPPWCGVKDVCKRSTEM